MTIYKKTMIRFVRPLVLTVLVLASLVASTRAHEVSIPDPGLSAAIRAFAPMRDRGQAW